MVANNELPPCSVCGDTYLITHKRLQDGVKIRCECQRCGCYDIAHEFEVIQPPPWLKVRHLVSAWVRRENKTKITPLIGSGADIEELTSPIWWEKQYKNMGFPETTLDKLNALLLAYARNVDENYDATLSRPPSLIAEIAAKNKEEIIGLTRLLGELGYLKYFGSYHVPRISAEGWLHIDELRKSTFTSDTAFIAMWFDETTKKYREAVIAAIQYCDYNPVILDQEEYNGFIMEQAVSQIKRARFVVADFTCRPESVENDKVKAGVRGGVYWEAGMAYGLSKHVIHTCEENEEAKIRRHFDIDQYNTIFWKSDDLNTAIRNISEKIDNPSFAEKLANRILRVVGKGSYNLE